MPGFNLHYFDIILVRVGDEISFGNQNLQSSCEFPHLYCEQSENFFFPLVLWLSIVLRIKYLGKQKKTKTRNMTSNSKQLQWSIA